jgi:DNA polymerase-3 subunit alpha
VVKAQAVCKLGLAARTGEGLIVLSGAQAGPVGQALVQGGRHAPEVALQLASMFPHRFYIELQRAGRPDDEPMWLARCSWPRAQACRWWPPTRCSSPARTTTKPTRLGSAFPKAKSWATSGGCASSPASSTSSRRADAGAVCRRALGRCQYLRDRKRCSLTLELGKPRLPDFPTPGGMPIDEYFRLASHEGLKERMRTCTPTPRSASGNAALRGAAGIRDQHHPEDGFPGLLPDRGRFHQLGQEPMAARWGPGRGSGAGSLVAYSLKITDLDPLQYNLLFERFLNPERVSMPDFDIDFCQTNRDRVIDYVKQKYGKDAVSQIATFGTMAARAAIRDVGRVLDMSYTFCDGISKLIPNKPGSTSRSTAPSRSNRMLAERLERKTTSRPCWGWRRSSKA